MADLNTAPAVIEAIVDRMTEPYRYMELHRSGIGWAARAVNRDGVAVYLPIPTTGRAHG